MSGGSRRFHQTVDCGRVDSLVHGWGMGEMQKTWVSLERVAEVQRPICDPDES